MTHEIFEALKIKCILVVCLAALAGTQFDPGQVDHAADAACYTRQLELASLAHPSHAEYFELLRSVITLPYLVASTCAESLTKENSMSAPWS